MTDTRTFVIECSIRSLDRSGWMNEARVSDIVVLANGKPERKPPIGNFIEQLVQMLWLDAYEGGPWTPSFVETATFMQANGSLASYRRKPKAD